MLSDREYVHRIAYSMKVGQQATFDLRLIQNAFPAPLLSDRPPVDGLLESLIGANYGTFRATVDPMKREVTLSRHEESKERVREDWDRR
jgi:hypothetical protein